MSDAERLPLSESSPDIPPWAIAVFGLVTIPVLAIYLCAPVVFQAYYQDSAHAHAGRLNLAKYYVTYTRVPCQSLFDGGFEVEYQMVAGEKPRTGRLCRAVNNDWTWYPDPRG